MIDVSTDMQSKKSLFIIGTPMQLVTALHLVNEFSLMADAICLPDHLPNANVYTEKLQTLKVFNTVVAFDVVDINFSRLKIYDEIFVVNNAFIELYGQILKASGIRVNIYDEGILNYIREYTEKSYHITGGNTIYLYEPTLASYYGDSRFSIHKIPKIETTNAVLLRQLDCIFDADVNQMLASKSDTLHVFFSQPFEHTLSVKAKLRRIFKIRQSHSTWEYVLSKHRKYQKIIIETIQQNVLSLYRKFHPREKERVLDENTIQWNYPWELYLLHHPHTKVVQYSLFSSVLTSSFVLGNSYNIKNYYLYPIVVKELIELGYTDALDNDLLTFFERLVKAGKVTPVYSLEELERIIQHEV